MKKTARSILYLLLLGTLLAVAAYFSLRGEFGEVPSAREEASYAALGYYRDGRFRSPREVVFHRDRMPGGRMGFLRFFARSPNAPEGPLPKVALDGDSFPETPSDYALYWLGHSSAILELDGKRLLFDPVFGNAAPLPFMVPRYDAAPVAREELPPLDYIVVTHNHYDHLERRTVRAVAGGRFIVPLGVGAALRGWGIAPDRITELGWGESFRDGGLTLTALESVHFSGRSFSDRDRTLWASYVVSSDSGKIFWGGDGGYGEHFARIGREHGPFDLAALEIDGWNDAWPRSHMFPREAVRAALDLRAARVLPVHWGVFDLAGHPWHESIDAFLKEAEGKPFRTLTPRMGERVGPRDCPEVRWWR